MLRPDRLKRVLNALRMTIQESFRSQDESAASAAIDVTLTELLLEIESAEDGDNFTQHAALVLQTFEEIGLPDAQPDVMGQITQGIGKTYERLGDTSNAYDAYTRALEFATSAHDDGLAAGCRRRMGRVMTKTADLETAEQHLLEGRDLYERVGDKLGAAQTLCDIGSLHYQRGQIAEADGRYTEALAIAEELDATSLIINLRNNLGVLANIRGDIDGAIGHYEQCVTLAEAAGNEPLLAQAYHNLGMAHADKQDWAGANEMYEQALELARKKGLGQLIGTTYLNKAELYLALSDVSQAAATCGKALSVFKTSGDKLSEAEAYRVLGDIFARRGSSSSALKMLDQSIEMTKLANAPLEIAEAYRAKGLVCERLGQNDTAAEAFGEAITHFDTCDATQDKAATEQDLARVTGAA